MAKAEQLRQELMDGLDASDFKYKIVSESDNIVRLGFSADCFDGVVDVEIYVDFDESDPCTSVHFVCPSLLRVPDDKRAIGLVKANEANERFRWVKCYISDDGTLNVDGDEHVSAETVADDCIRSILAMGGICQEIYKMMMSAIYAS